MLLLANYLQYKHVNIGNSNDLGRHDIYCFPITGEVIFPVMLNWGQTIFHNFILTLLL